LPEARADARRAIRLDPGCELAHAEMAHIAAAANDLDEALRWAEKAHKLAPGGTDALEALARVRLARGERDAARAAVEALLGVNPEHSWAKEEIEALRASAAPAPATATATPAPPSR